MPITINRLLFLDVFRGLTIALMILVNSPGNQNPYPFLNHANWVGCNLADLVFPFFVFIVGVSTVFSLSKRQDIPKKFIFIRILRRSLIIFFIGLFLNAFPNHFDFTSIRILGVLQRIALCYFFSAILFLTTSLRAQALLMAMLLIGYFLIMNWPGFNLSLEGNFAAFFDRLFLAPSHLYSKFYDPEGLLSTIPAIATVLLGNITGGWLLTKQSPSLKLQGMFLGGLCLLFLGWSWSFWFPINKTLWTSSYALWTGGLALLTLALCYWLIEIKQWQKWSKPFEIFGVNALAAYILHILFLKIQVMIHISQPNGTNPNLKFYLTEMLFGWTFSQNAALLYALSYSLFWLLILSLFYYKKILIKI